MLSKIGEWLLVIALCALVILIFMWGGILISAAFIVMLVCAVIASVFGGLSSLFRRSGATTGRREEKD